MATTQIESILIDLDGITLDALRKSDDTSIDPHVRTLVTQVSKARRNYGSTGPPLLIP